MTVRLLNDFLLLLSSGSLIAEKGEEFFSLFSKIVRQELRAILPEVPKIGDSIFKSSYLIGVCFIA